MRVRPLPVAVCLALTCGCSASPTGAVGGPTPVVQADGPARIHQTRGGSLPQAGAGCAINGGKVPSDANGVSFGLTSADVNETSGFCTQYCGWHNNTSIGGKDIKYSFVGNPDRCPSACEQQSASSPNNNPGADGM